MAKPVRQIADELYRDQGYDALWRLPNAGFALRLGGVYVFIDAVMSYPHPTYAATREQTRRDGRSPHFVEEFRHYDPETLTVEENEVPLRAEEVEKADYVLITHEHEDHLDGQAMGQIAKLGPTVLAPNSCHPPLLDAGVPQELLVTATYGDIQEFDGFSVEVIPADHTAALFATRPADACGFLLRTEHGNIYILGDGNFDHEHKAKVTGLDVDYLLLPINDTNLGVGFAALMTHLLQPRVVVPCHYGFVYPPVRSQGGHPAEFVTALAARNYSLPTTDIVILRPGGRLVLA